MKVSVYRVPGRHNEDHLSAMGAGLLRHGNKVEYFSDAPDMRADAVVVWSWRVGLRMRDRGYTGPILVMERGYIGDRFKWTSLGWNGLNGRAIFAKVDDATRWDKNFAHLMKPWRMDTGYALICGQVVGDTALIGTNIKNWYNSAAKSLNIHGWDVRFRQHPVEIERGVEPIVIDGAKTVDGTLEDAFAGAGLVVTFNSNSGVDAMLAGTPVHAADKGAMVYDLASQEYKPRRPCRAERFRQLAWCQWSMDEIKSGAAWDVVKGAMFTEIQQVA